MTKASQQPALQELKQELKALIVDECEKDEINPMMIQDDEPLFGSDSNVGLDSLDALQIAMALQQRYGVKITDSKKVRKVMRNINSLADYLNER